MNEAVPQPSQADRIALYSGAQSFLSFLEKGVDTRTGTYTVRVALPAMSMNALAGPELKLSLGFDPLQNVDAGLGLGWNWGFTQLQPAARRLRLSDGESHLAILSDASLLLPDKKLPSFTVERFATSVVVTYRSGQREILEPFQPSDPLTPWVPVEIVSPQGRSVFLSWQSFEGEPALATMSDQDRGELLHVTRTPQAVNITIAGPVPVVYELALSDHIVSAIHLPLPGKPGWSFKYARYTDADLVFLTEVTSPTGSVERMVYEEDGHRFPARSDDAPGTPPTYLPYVVRHVMEPGGGQPPRVTTYSYSTHNFLGYDAGVDWEDATDGLYKVTADYRYSSVESQMDESGTEPVVLATVYREFNRFHLLMEERREEGGCEHTQSNVYHDETGKPYSEQPAIVQLPREQTVKWQRGGVSRSEVTTHKYDAWGNPVEIVMPDGVRQTTDYYLPAGEDGCPPDPVWKTPRTVKAHTMVPGEPTPRSPDMKPTALAPTRVQRFRYARYPSLASGGADYLAVSEQSQLADGVTFDAVAITYFNQPTSALLHGRVRQRTQTLGGHTSTVDFAYAKVEGELVTTTTRHTDVDDTESSTVTHTSIHTGLNTLTQTTDEIVTLKYDVLGRVVEESTTPTSGDAAYTTTLKYAYTFPSAPGGSVTQQTTRESGIVETAYFDGTGLTVRLTRSTPDVAGGETLEFTRHDFDVRGRKCKSTITDRIDDKAIVRTMHFTYDGWGRCDAVTRPDGVIEHDEWNAVTQVASRWLEGGGESSGVTSRAYNRFTEIERETRTGTAGNLVSQWTYAYDGLGRRVSAVDTSRRETTYTYDFADRTSHVDLDNGDMFDYAYAAHSLDDDIAQVKVNGTELGARTFDGLMRVSDQTVGGRTTTWKFDRDRHHPTEQTNAAGQLVTFSLDPSLGEVPKHRTSRAVQTTYGYDPHTGQLSEASQTGGAMAGATYACTRYASGAAHVETWTDDAGEHKSTHQWTLLGLPASYKDATGKTHSYCYYPDTGQLQTYTCGDVVVTYTWNAFGRLSKQVVSQGATTRMTTTFQYDDFGREISREMVAPGRAALVVTQGYNDLDLLVSRTRIEGGVTQLDESMAYDRRDRLDLYYTMGAASPPDPHDPSKRISVQQWVHDAFDNVTEILTWHEGEGNAATATYHYENDDDPTQLTAFERTGYGAANGRFALAYDAAGRVIDDGLGNTYTYNEQDQMMSAQRSGQTPTEYGYNALDEQALVTRSGEPTRRRIFRRNKLAVEVQETLARSYLDGAVGSLDSAGQLLAYAVDQKSSVLEVHASDDATRGIAYAPSGYRRTEIPDSVPGHDGELVDPATQGLWLGNARLYSPVLCRFLVPDTYVPFEGGGLNAYARIDPLNSIDPTGHLPGWLGSVVTALTSVLAIGLAVVSAGILTPVSTAMVTAAAGATTAGAVAATGAATAAATGVSVASAVTSGVSLASMAVNFGLLSTVAQVSFVTSVSINTTIFGMSAANSIASATGDDELSGAFSFAATVLGAVDIASGLGFALANARMAARAANVGATGTRGSLTRADSVLDVAEDATNTPIGSVGGSGARGARSVRSASPETRPPTAMSMTSSRVGSEFRSLGGGAVSSSANSRASTPIRQIMPHGTATVMAVRSAGYIGGTAARAMSDLSSRPSSAMSGHSGTPPSTRFRSYDREVVTVQGRQIYFEYMEEAHL